MLMWQFPTCRTAWRRARGQSSQTAKSRWRHALQRSVAVSHTHCQSPAVGTAPETSPVGYKQTRRQVSIKIQTHLLPHIRCAACSARLEVNTGQRVQCVSAWCAGLLAEWVGSSPRPPGCQTAADTLVRVLHKHARLPHQGSGSVRVQQPLQYRQRRRGARPAAQWHSCGAPHQAR